MRRGSPRHPHRWRPSITWGDSCGMAKRATGPSLSGRVILVEGPVDDRGADLEHQMRSSRRPTHLLVGAHPAVQQPLYRTLGGRRRYRLVVSPGGGIIDDQTGLPGYVSLKATKHACHLTRGRGVRRYRFGRSIEYHQGVSDEIERQLYLPVPETPTDMLDGVGQAGSFRAVARRGVRPALGGLSDMLDAHREMKTIEHVMGRTDARRLAQRSWPIGAVAQDGDRRSRCGTKAMQHAAQLLLLPISLGRHAAKHDPLAGVVADLSDEDLERAYLVAAHRFHVTPVDGERDRPSFARRTRRWRCHGIAFQSGADAHRSLTDRLDFWGVPEREELFDQRAGAAVWQQGAHLGEGALILRRAAVGHDLRGRGDAPARRHAASEGTKTGSNNLHNAKQRRQPPPAPVLQRPLSPAPLAVPSIAAMRLRSWRARRH